MSPTLRAALRRAALAAAVCAASATAAAAATLPSPFLVQGSISDYWLDGTPTGAILDADVAAGQSSFNNNFAIETKKHAVQSGSTLLSEVPIVENAWFEVFFDSQQNNKKGNTELRLTSIQVLIDGDLVWRLPGLASPIILNRDGSTLTDSPNGNGRDFRILIPLRYAAEAAQLNGAIHRGSSTFTITWVQENSSGSPDEWELGDCTLPGYACLGANESLPLPPDIVPVPPAAPLLATALAALWLRRRRAA